MLNLNTALSALHANRVALDVIGNNIANANTPGYHRQGVRLTEREPVELGGYYLGQGVRVAEIHRAFDAATEAAINQNSSEQAYIAARLRTAQQIESQFAPQEGSLGDRLEKLFGQLQRLTAEPDDDATRSMVVQSAEQLANTVGKLNQQMDQMTTDLDREIESALKEIGRYSAEILDLNNRIQAAVLRGQSPNDLLDQRDQLVDSLSQLIDVRLETQVHISSDVQSAQTVLHLANGQIASAAQPIELLSTVNSTGQRIVVAAGATTPLTVASGKLGGLLAARNEMVTSSQHELEKFTNGLITAFDAVHATGLGLSGSFEVLSGGRGIDQVTLPLASVSTVVPVRQGSLFINVTAPDGMRALHEVSIDPATDSLQDIMAKFSAIDHLQAVVDVGSGQVSFLSEPGYKFDFTGQPPASPDSSQITGSSRPTVQGTYRGQANTSYTFRFAQAGTIGVSDQLTLTMQDPSGNVVATMNVGRDYEPGSALDIGDGIQVRLSTGNVNAGDQFSVQLVSDPDTTGFLAAFGLNTLFVGNGPANLQVNPALRRDARVLATTRTGQPLDSRNAQAMLDLRYKKLIDGNTLEEHLANLMAGSGAQSRDLGEMQDNLEVVGTALQSERQSLSGVDPNEEAIRMIQYQRAFQAASRYVVTIEETLDELFAILR